MVCGKCARENRPDSRFCAGCGTALTLRCSACDRELQPDAAFCDGCGTAVAGATPTATPPAPPAEPTAVRKTVTALFCDLVGSTAFGEKVDPEAARESMNRYFAMARTAIEDNGGMVAKFIGDGVMAMWGVPEVAEDDAERAVRAGLDLQEAFTGIRDFIKDRHGVTVGLRVGINTGEVVISDADDDVVGDALNTAARLEAACTPGRVLVGEPTWRLSRGTVHYTDHGVIQAKGKEEPVASYEVVGLLDVEDPHTETPFVGRDAELRRLQVVMDEAILERTARLVTVIGSPGVGKTRLAREMREAVEGGTRAFELRCEREGMATFAPVADLLRAAAGITDANSVEEMRDRLRSLVDPLEDADRVAELLAGFVGAAPMQSTEELFLAVRRLFEVLGATQPVVLIVDDIQWAEPLFLDLLEHLAEWVRDVPLMVVCLARPEIRDVRPPITEPGRRVSAVVALEGLDTEATHELAARLVGADALPADLLAKIPESTQGNPLFVRELMRMLVDDGVIAERDGRWEMVIDVDAVEVPPTVNTLLASRVERLQIDERQALEFASVVGSDFPVGAVAAAAGDSTGLSATFERLRRKELIEPTGTYWGDEPVFRFHHVLIRDAAYRRLLKGNRAELHVTIGDWTERSAASLVGEHEVTIAHHFEQAHELRLQLGIDDEETDALGTRAAGLLRTAADRALDREDLAAAGPLAARALACVDDEADGLAELLLTACESLLGTGNVAAGVEAVDRLDAVAGDDRRLRAWVECFRAEVAIYTDPGALQGVIESAGRAADVLAELDDQAGVAKARLQRAAALVRLGRVGDCEAELDAALTAARAADDRRRVTAVLGSAPIAALWGPSPVPRAGGRCLDVVRLLRITTGSPAVEATSIRCQAVLESLRGRHDTARTMLENARSTLEEIGHDHGLMETAYFAGLVELLADDPAAAEPHLRRAHDGLGRLGIGADAGQAAAYLARALLLQDRLDEAEDYALRSDALAGQNPQTAIVSRSVQAEILAARGEFDEALTLAAEAVHLAAGTDILVDHANAVAAQARVRAAAGDAAGAAEAAATAAALYEEKGATVDVGVTSPAIEPTPDVAPPTTTDEDPAWASARAYVAAIVENAGVGPSEQRPSLFAEDVEVHDRRSIVGGGEDGREMIRDFVGVSDQLDIDVELLAVRGEGLHAARWRMSIEGQEYSWIGVGRRNADGVTDYFVRFDDDAFDDATAELDRLAAERDAPEWMVTFEKMRVAHEHMTAGQVDDWAAMLSDDFVWVEHRQGVRLEAVGRDEARNTLQTILHEPDPDEEPPATPRRADEEPPDLEITPVDGRGRNLALARVLTYGGGTSRFEREYLLLGRIRAEDGLGNLAMAFDVDDIEAARAELDRLYGQETGDLTPQTDARLSPDNLATAASSVVSAAVRVGSPDIRDLVGDGVDLAATPHAFGVTERRPVAVRGENLALFEATLDSGDRAWSVEQYDDDGRLLEWRLFEADRLIDAADHLDERFLALTPNVSEWERVALEYARCHRHLDMDGFRRILTDDFMASDHRSFGFPTVDLEQFLAVPSQIEARGVLISNDVGHRHGPVGPTHNVIYDAEAGGPIERLAGVALLQVREGKVARTEMFAEDDLDGAMARLDELTSGQTRPAPTGRSGGDRTLELRNTATEQFAATGQTGRVEAVYFDSLALIEGEDGHVVVVANDAGHPTIEPIGGRSAGYARMVALNADVETGFDMRLVAELGVATLEHDRARLEALFGPDFRADMSRLDGTFPVFDRAELIDLIVSGERAGLEATVRKGIAWADGVWCGWMTTASDSEVATDNLIVIRWDDSHITEQIHFPTDQLQEALAEFDRGARLGHELSIAEKAARWVQDGGRISPQEAIARTGSKAAENYRAIDHRAIGQTEYSHRQAAANADHYWSDARSIDIEILEARGARYVVSTTTWIWDSGFETRTVDLSRFNGAGRWDLRVEFDTEADAIEYLDELEAEELRSLELRNTATMVYEAEGRPVARVEAVDFDLLALIETGIDPAFVVVSSTVGLDLTIEHFDTLADAYLRFGALSAEQIDSDANATLNDYGRAVLEHDVATLERILAPGFEIDAAAVPGMFPSVTRDEMRALIASNEGMDVQERVRKTLGLAPGAYCGLMTSGMDETSVTNYLAVIGWANDQIQTHTVYPTHQLDQALAHFDELAKGRLMSIGERSFRSAVAAFEQSVEQGARRAFETKSPDVKVIDRRSVSASTEERFTADPGSDWYERVSMELLVARGARLTLCRTPASYPGGFESERFDVARWGVDGTWELVVHLDTEAEALAVLDELEAEECRSPELRNTATMAYEAAGHPIARVEGADFDLFALIDTGVEPRFAVVESSVSGQLTIEHFDTMSDAHGRFRVLSAEQMAAVANVVPLREYALAHAARDTSELERVLAPNFAFDTSELPLAFPSLTRDEFIALSGENGTFGIDDRVRKTLGITDGAYCGLITQARDDETDVLDSFHVIGWTEGRVTTHKAYPPDQLDQALAHFDGLSGAVETSPIENNLAWLLAGYESSAEEGRRREMEIAAPDAVVDDRRAMLALEQTLDEYRDVYAEDSARLEHLELELLPERGERTAITKLRGRYVGGFDVDFFVAIRFTDDGLWDAQIYTDTEAEALAALDELGQERDDSTPVSIAEGFRDRSFAFVAAGDVDGYLSLVSPNVLTEDRRTGGGSTVELAQVAESVQWIVDQQIRPQEVTTLATDARTVASRIRFWSPLSETELVTYMVARYDLVGMLTRAIWVDTETDALAALDEIRDEELRSLELRNTATMAYEAAGHPIARVEAVELDLVAVIDTGSTPQFAVARANRFGGLEVEHFKSAADAHDHARATDPAPAIGFDPTTIRAYGAAAFHKDVEALERLLAPEFTLDASRLPSYFSVFTRDELIAFIASGRGLGVDETTRKTLGITDGALVALFASAGDETHVTDFITVVAWSGAQITAQTSYRVDQLDDALAHFDQLSALTSPPPRSGPGAGHTGEVTPNLAARVAIARDHALFTEPDEAAWLATLAEDVVADERQGILPRTVHGTAALRREYSEIIRSSIDFVAETTVLAVASDHVALCRLRVFESDAPRTDAGVFLDLLNLCETNADGLIQRSVTFDAENLAEAQRDFARWAEPDPPARVPLNTAARAALRNNRALFDQPGEEAWLATFADDVVVDDRQRMAKRTLRGKDEIRDDYISVSQRATKFGFDVETEVLGVRDDNFAITLMRVFESDGDGRSDTDVFLDHVAIYRTNEDGLIDRCAMFDVADENDAWAELARWWAESMDPPERALMLEEVRQGRLFQELRFAEWRAGHHPEYVSTDHRPFGFGTTDTEGMAGRNDALTDVVEGGTVRFPVSENLGLGVRVATIEADLVRRTGAQARIELSYVSIADLVNGGGRWNHQFALEDIDDARRRGQEVVDQRRKTTALTEAVAVGGLASGRARQSAEHFVEMLHEDFQATLLDGVAIPRDAVASGKVDPAVLGFGHVERSVVSNDGTVGLFRVGAPGGDAWLQLEVVDDLQLRVVEQFPIAELQRAAPAFDERSMTEYDDALQEVGRLGLRFRQAMNRRDVAELDAVISSDFEVIDRRQLMYGSVEREAYLTLMSDLGELPDPVLIGEVLASSERGWLFRGWQAIPGPGGWTENNAGVFVITTAADRIQRLECFDEDDLDAAQARFEELTAAPVARSFAEAVGFEWIDRARRGDVDGVMALHPEGGMEISEDTWGSEFDMDEAEYQRVLETVLRDVQKLEPSPIDYRGPRFTAGHVALETSSAEMNWITVAECLPDGRFNRLRMLGSATEAVATLDRWLEAEQRSLDLHNSATIFFEASGQPFVEVAAVEGDDRAIVAVDPGFLLVVVDEWGAVTAEAFDTFAAAERAMRPQPPEAAGRVRGAAEFGDAIREHDAEALDLVLARTYRGESFGDFEVIPGDRTGFIDYVRSGSAAAVEERVPKILASSAVGACVLSRVIGDNTVVDRINVVVGDETGVTYNGIWPVDMVDTALTRFDELSARAEAHSFAHRAGLEWSERARAGDTQAILDLQVTPDLLVAEQTWGSTLEMGVEGYEQSLDTLLSDVSSLDVSYIGHRGPRMVAAHLVMHTSSAEVRWVTVASYEPSGRFSRLEVLTSATEAQATMDRWLKEEQRSLELRNSATMFYEHAGHPFVEVAAVRGDHVAVVETEPGFTVVEVDDFGELSLDHVASYEEAYQRARSAATAAESTAPANPSLAAFSAAIAAADRDELEEVLSPAFELEVFGSLDVIPTTRAELIDFVVTAREFSIEQRRAKLLAHAPSCACFLVRTIDAAHGTSLDRIHVFAADDTGLTYIGMWPVEMLDEALAKFDELSAATDAALDPLDAVAAGIGAALLAGDADAFAAHFAEDLDYRSDRTLADVGGGKAQLIENYVTQTGYVWSSEPIVRVGRAGVFRVNASLPGDNELEWCVLVTVNDQSLIDRWHVREMCDLRLALADAADAQPDDRDLALVVATNRFDHDAHRRALGSLVTRDHRPTSVLDALDADAWMQVQADTVEMHPNTALWFDVRRSSDRALYVEATRWADPADDAPTWNHLCVFGRTAGRFTSLDLFDLSQEAEAVARFEELSTSTVTDIRDVSTSIEAALSAGDLDAFAAHFAEDLDFRNESVLSDAGGGKQQMLENIASQGDYTWSGELIVSVGRASVFRLTADLPGDNQLQWCLFATVNDDGLIDRWHVREVEHLRFAFNDAMRSLGDIPGLDMMAAFNAGDETALAATVADDFVFHDHRTSSVLGDLDATEWLRLQAESMRLFPASAHWVEIVDHTNDVAMGTIIRWSDPGGPSDWRFITVQAHREGRATSIDIFGPEEVDRARSRFDQLAMTPNRSAELSFHRTALLQARDEEAFKALLHPDYTSRSHQSLGRPDVGSRDEYMDLLRTFAPVGFPAPRQVDLIATRGDKLALLETKMATDDGWTNDLLVLHQIDDDGLLRFSAVWDADQLDAATAELDRLWAEELAGD